MTVERSPDEAVRRGRNACRMAVILAVAALLSVTTGSAAAQIDPRLTNAPAAVAPPLASESWTRRLPPAGRWLGGLSGLAPLPPDPTAARVDRYLGLSDRGYLVELRIGGSLLAAFPRGRIPTGPGRGRDAEALVPVPGSGWWIALERDHRLHRTGEDPAGTVLEVVRPPQADSLPRNRGMEALARLPDGTLVAVAEGATDGTVPLWHLAADGRPLAIFRLPIGDGFRPVDALGLPDGGLLLLERRYVPILGFAVRMRLWPGGWRAAAAATGALDWGRPAVPVGRLPAANWEGMAFVGASASSVSSGPPGLLLVSDNNFDGGVPTLVARRPAGFVTLP